MTYQEFIQNIIDTRGQWNIQENEYYEKHHIIPVCIGGDGDFINREGRPSFYKNSKHPNCIYLYPSEHFIAHKLLAEENPDNDDLVYAFSCMVQFKVNKLQITPEEYGLNRILLANSPKIKWHESMNARTEEDKRQSELQRKQTKLGKYGDATYNNQEKRKQTINNKSDEEKLNTYLKWKASNENKSAEEKQLTHFKRINSHKNKSSDEKLLIKNKMLKTRAAWSDAKKLELKKKQSLASSGGNNGMAKAVLCINTNEKIYLHKRCMCTIWYF